MSRLRQVLHDTRGTQESPGRAIQRNAAARPDPKPICRDRLSWRLSQKNINIYLSILKFFFHADTSDVENLAGGRAHRFVRDGGGKDRTDASRRQSADARAGRSVRPA